MEVCYAEADLRMDLADCEKNPGHRGFIPVDKFNVNSLPKRYQHSDLVKYIRALSGVTVRLDVRYVSPDRPATFPDSNQPYPRYSDRGRQKLGVGTGWVSDVTYLQSCYGSKTTKEAAYIHIITACHLVFDELEAAQTSCHLFFDRGRSPELCKKTVTLIGASKIEIDIASDWCVMTYTTYDLDLAHKLDKLVSRLWKLQDSCDRRFGRMLDLRSSPNAAVAPIVNPEDALTIIVSHPHGCSKHVSIGNCTYLSVSGGRWTKYIYTTATCTGSSGAPVFVLGTSDMRPWFSWCTHVHCGNCKRNKELNYGTYTLAWPRPETRL